MKSNFVYYSNDLIVLHLLGILFLFFCAGENKKKGNCCLKKNQNAPRPSEHPPVRGEKVSKLLGGIKGYKYKKSSSWHLNGFPDGNNIGSTV